MRKSESASRLSEVGGASFCIFFRKEKDSEFFFFEAFVWLLRKSSLNSHVILMACAERRWRFGCSDKRLGEEECRTGRTKQKLGFHGRSIIYIVLCFFLSLQFRRLLVMGDDQLWCA